VKKVLFCTTNSDKFATAKSVLDKADIPLEQIKKEVPEIQSEDPKEVAVDKARKVYELIKEPVVVTDDSWSFEGLNGFPGVYMHSMNQWFKPEDFLRLVLPLENRNVTLTQYLVYVDNKQTKVFLGQTKGTLLKEVKGVSDHPSHSVITLEGDDGISIAEAYTGKIDKSKRGSAKVWHEFVEWYKTSNIST